MNDKTSEKPRIRMPADLEKQVIEPLVEHNHFESKQEVMTFAAALGFRLEKRTPIQKFGGAIRRDVFENTGHDVAIDIIGIADDEVGAELNEKLASIGPAFAKQRISAFEEYAATGLNKIRTMCFGGTMDVETGLRKLVHLYGSPKGSEIAESIEDIFGSLGS